MKTLMRGVSVWLMLLWIFYPLRGYETDAFTLWEAAVRFLVLGLLFGASALVTYILPEKKKRRRRLASSTAQEKIHHHKYSGKVRRCQEKWI